MTIDEANAAQNKIILACKHDIVLGDESDVRRNVHCRRCGGKFALVLLPVTMPVMKYEEEE